MLIHVTATHSEENCPAFNRERMPDLTKALAAREEAAKKYNVKLLGMWSSAPGHTFYSVIEANSPQDVGRFLLEVTPVKQDFTLTPVIAADEMIQFGRGLSETPGR